MKNEQQAQRLAKSWAKKLQKEKGGKWVGSGTWEPLRSRGHLIIQRPDYAEGIKLELREERGRGGVLSYANGWYNADGFMHRDADFKVKIGPSQKTANAVANEAMENLVSKIRRQAPMPRRKPTKAPKAAPTKKAPKTKAKAAKAPRVSLPKVGTLWTTAGRTWKLVETNPTARDPYERATLELLKPTKLDLDYKIGHRMTVEPAWFTQPGRTQVSEAPKSASVKKSSRKTKARAKLSRLLKKKKTKKAPAKAKAAPAKAPRASVPKALSIDSGPEKLALGAPKTVAKIFRDTFAKLRTQRKEALTFIRARAKDGLAATRKRFAEKRVDLVAKLKEIQRNELLRLAQRKDAELKLAKDVYEAGTARTKAIKRATAEHRAHLKAMKARHSVSMGRVVAARRASEKRGENLDRVRQNIEREHPEMLAYFDKVKSKLKPSPNMSRTERFYQLAHDNPGEVILASERLGDRRLRDSLKNAEKTWENRAKRMEAQLCKRAHRDFMRSRPFRLKVSERRALEKLGVDPEGLEVACYRPARRIVSGRGASARKTDVPF